MNRRFGALLTFVLLSCFYLTNASDIPDVRIVEWPWESWLYGPPCPVRHHQQLVEINTSLLRGALEEVNILLGEEVSGLAESNIQTGITISVVYGQQVLLAKGYGTLNKSTTEPPNINTIYDIGSITKVFTSLALFHSVDKGFVNLDDKVTKFFNEQNPPVFSINNPYSSEGADAVTLRSLAAQSSGLPREPYCGAYPITSECADDDTAAQLNMDALSKLGLLFSPMTGAHYSNLGLSLLGRCLERAWNEKYEDYMVNSILLPLGMNSSGFTFTPEVKARMISGYKIQQFANGTYYTLPTTANTLEAGWAAPCAGLYTSTADLISFFQFIFNNTDSPVISQQMLDLFFTPAVPLPDGISSFGSGTWEIFYANNYTTFTKGGLPLAMAASISMIPELKLGVSVMINVDSGAQADKMNAEIMKIIVPALEVAIQKSQKPLPLPPNYQSLLGNYGSGLSTVVSIQEGTPGSGVLKGYVLGPGDVYFIWDQAQDFGNSTAFRYSSTQTHFQSCMNLVGSNNAVAFFSVYKGKQVVSLTDENVSLYVIPKKK